MDETTIKWLRQLETRCNVQAEAYRLRLGFLWWMNLIFFVAPTMSTSLAAVLAAIKPVQYVSVLCIEMPIASVFAAAAAVLIAVHQALKCEEYQAECLRLSQAYASIAVAADAALAKPDEKDLLADQKRLSDKLEALVEGAHARLPTSIIEKAKRRIDQARS